MVFWVVVDFSFYYISCFFGVCACVRVCVVWLWNRFNIAINIYNTRTAIQHFCGFWPRILIVVAFYFISSYNFWVSSFLEL